MSADEDDPGAINASDAERDATCDVLRAAAGEGRLTFEELADRIEAALTARTRGELARLTRDLPTAAERSPARTPPAARSSPRRPPSRRRSSATCAAPGVWRVPAYSSWSTVLGDRRPRPARGAHRTLAGDDPRPDEFGNVEILVPEGVAVDVRVSSLLGSVKQHADAVDPAAPRVIVTGRTILGDVRVQHKRLRERSLIDCSVARRAPASTSPSAVPTAPRARRATAPSRPRRSASPHPS